MPVGLPEIRANRVVRVQVVLRVAVFAVMTAPRTRLVVRAAPVAWVRRTAAVMAVRAAGRKTATVLLMPVNPVVMMVKLHLQLVPVAAVAAAAVPVLRVALVMPAAAAAPVAAVPLAVMVRRRARPRARYLAVL